MRQFFLIALLAISTLGCGVPRRFVVGRVTSVTATQLWERTLATLDDSHYVPDVVDPNRGVIVVPSRVYGSRLRIVIQLYREGWVQVFPERPGTRYMPRIPEDLAEEQLELTMSLREHLLDEPDSSGGAQAEPES